MPVESDRFVTTRWSLVVAAGRADSTRARASLEPLCRGYWYPLYAFARRSGQKPEDAEDLTQEFFTRLLAKNYVADADREKGRFRTFLIAAFKHFLAKEWRKEQALKPEVIASSSPLTSRTPRPATASSRPTRPRRSGSLNGAGR